MAKDRPRRGSPLHLTPSFELFGKSRDIVLKNIWIFGPLYALPLIFTLHSWLWAPIATPGHHHFWGNADSFNSGLSSSPFPTYAWSSIIGFSILWFLIVAVVGTIVHIMTQVAQLEAAESKTPAFDRLWVTTKEIGWRLIGVYLLSGIIILVGFVLLIIPGIIMLRRYFLAPYVMIDKKCGVRDAMEQSAAMSKPYSDSVYGILGVMLLIALLGIIPFIGTLVSFFLGMLYSIAPALRYQEIKKLS